jgi:hypothetical protein
MVSNGRELFQTIETKPDQTEPNQKNPNRTRLNQPEPEPDQTKPELKQIRLNRTVPVHEFNIPV